MVPLQRTRQSFYRPELDGLRFLAFLFVFTGHAFSDDATYYLQRGLSWTPAHALSHIVHVGRYGVPLFFVLSSYLITELLIREHQQKGSIDVWHFYIRRALRIWPLYFFFVFAAYAALALGHNPDARLPPRYLLSLLLFLSNWGVAWKWGPTAGDTFSSPLWSVSVEEQFYLAWPLLLGMFGIIGIRRLALVLIALAVLARLAMDVGGAQETTYWYSTFTWLDAIGSGALAALLLKGGVPRVNAGTRVLLFGAGVGLWLVASVTLRMLPVGSIFYPLIVGGSILIFWSAAGSQFLAYPALVYLGRMSYGLYVFHSTGLALATLVFPRLSGGNALGGLAVTVLMAAVSYRWLESPFLRLKKRFTYVESRPIDETATPAAG